MGQKEKAFFARLLSFFFMLLFCVLNETAARGNHNNAYATMIYMGTPRDYEFYVATRVMIRSLSSLGVDADLVVIASSDVPLSWLQSLELEDGARVVKVKNLDNPYKKQANFDKRFKLTLNKLYAWSLVEYERVVMLDSDNLFLQKTDELFQCGQFCAAFINPCIFHTGLFVLQPSMEVFQDMTHELETGKENQDGADQGFIGGYFPDLLDQPIFHPPPNGTKLDGKYRLPLGYQMDASYYYLRLSWNVPCGPNSVITFPGAPLLKPWYWWSWPVLPLGFQWHEQRRRTLGYGPEMPMVLVLSATYLGIMVLLRLGRPMLPKLCYRYTEKGFYWPQISLKLLVLWSLLASYIIPILFIPCTIHPLIGWTLYMCGSFALLSTVISAFLLPTLAMLVPWLEILGALLVMAFPWYSSGIVRALTVFFYAFCCSPAAWMSLARVMESLHSSADKEAYFLKLGHAKGDPLALRVLTAQPYEHSEACKSR